MKLFSFLRKPSFDTHIATSLEQAKFDSLHAEDSLAEAKLRSEFYKSQIDRLKSLLSDGNKSPMEVHIEK
jgi:hypothetical protein